MEYVEGGQPIDEFCQQNSVKDKVRLFLQVVEAVAAAHKHQAAHLDLTSLLRDIYSRGRSVQDADRPAAT